MDKDIQAYNDSQIPPEAAICNELMQIIDENLTFTESKIWHSHPVWFIDKNPIVGYSKLKDCIRLMFWSGMSFEEKDLEAGTGKFKDASIRYSNADQIDETKLKRWLKKAEEIQWDYKNVIKRKGKLVRLK